MMPQIKVTRKIYVRKDATMQRVSLITPKIISVS
jgi:hypothetical protein